MTETVKPATGQNTDLSRAALPEGEAYTRARLSIVWLIPLVALMVGGWLAYKSWSEKGPTVTIAFKAAAGLQVGKTVIKFKDVEIGKVTAVRVSEDLKGVLVSAELVAGTERWLNEGTRFWIARPRVAAGRVSGLETLLSGAFIEMDPVAEGKRAKRFVGLEEPPLFKTDEPGKRFMLHSDGSGTLSSGAPVYYRGQQVGQVISSRLDDIGKMVNIEVFIKAPHDRLVRTSTRFWNISGFDVTLSADGIRIDSESFVSLLLGGVTFDTLATLDGQSREVEEGEVFLLYPSREAAHARIYETKVRYLLFFDGSVRGLSIGAPVLLRGIKIGEVLDVRLDFNVERFEFEIPVLIEIEPERVNIKGNTDGLQYDQVIEQLVVAGLRGQLQTGSLVTGQLYIQLALHPDAPQAAITEHDGYKVVPTVPAPLEAVAGKINGLLGTLNRLPLERIAAELLHAVEGAGRLLNSQEASSSLSALQRLLSQTNVILSKLDGQLVPEAAATLHQARATLADAQRLVVAGDAVLVGEGVRLLRELIAAARSIKELAEYLERHPEALIRGKGTR